MVQFQIFSDLHLELYRTAPFIFPYAPNLILCGDICAFESKVHFQAFFADVSARWRNVFFIPGNHEYYGGASIEKTAAHMRQSIAQYSNVYYMDNQTLWIDARGETVSINARVGDLCLIGSTLWSRPDPARCHLINDFEQIKITPQQMANRCAESEAYIWAAAEDARDKGAHVAVITHFPPVFAGAQDSKYPFNSYFTNDLEARIEKSGINWWIFGHTHWVNSFNLGDTLLLTNAIGYPDECIVSNEERYVRLLGYIVNYNDIFSCVVDM